MCRTANTYSRNNIAFSVVRFRWRNDFCVQLGTMLQSNSIICTPCSCRSTEHSLTRILSHVLRLSRDMSRVFDARHTIPILNASCAHLRRMLKHRVITCHLCVSRRVCRNGRAAMEWAKALGACAASESICPFITRMTNEAGRRAMSVANGGAHSGVCHMECAFGAVPHSLSISFARGRDDDDEMLMASYGECIPLQRIHTHVRTRRALQTR